MLYCDIYIDGEAVWFGVPCVSYVDLASSEYLGFSGHLFFVDALHGSLELATNPEFSLLGTRYFLMFFPQGGSPNYEVPLDAVPSQTVNVILDGQNCTISIYDRAVDDV